MGDLNTPLSPINWSSRQKINKETSEILHTFDQMDMVDIYRVFHPTVISVAHKSLSKVDHILGHKIIHNKFKKIKITLNHTRSLWNKTELNNKEIIHTIQTHGD
jgi:hypothetical protein